MQKLLLLLLMTLPCAAQTSWKIDVQLVRLKAAAKLDYVVGPAEWLQQLKHAEILEQGSVVTTEKETSLFLGRKCPITYFDPRAGMPQVNYVDIGYKAQFSLNPNDDGRIQLDCTLEKKAIFDLKLPLPTIDVFQAYSTLLLKPGQVGIAAVSRGQVGASHLKGLYPGRVFSDTDTFVWAVCPHRI